MKPEKDSEYSADGTNYWNLPDRSLRRSGQDAVTLPEYEQQPRASFENEGQLPKSGKQRRSWSASVMSMGESLFKPKNWFERLFSACFVASLLALVLTGIARILIPVEAVKSTTLLMAILAVPALISAGKFGFSAIKAGMGAFKRTGISQQATKDLRTAKEEIGSWLESQTVGEWVGMLGFLVFCGLYSGGFGFSGSQSSDSSFERSGVELRTERLESERNAIERLHEMIERDKDLEYQRNKKR